MLMERMPTKRMSINTSFHNLTWRNQVKLEVFTGSSGGVAVTDNCSPSRASYCVCAYSSLAWPLSWHHVTQAIFILGQRILCISKRPNIASSLCTNSLFSCPTSFSNVLYKQSIQNSIRGSRAQLGTRLTQPQLT